MRDRFHEAPVYDPLSSGLARPRKTILFFQIAYEAGVANILDTFGLPLFPPPRPFWLSDGLVGNPNVRRAAHPFPAFVRHD